MDTDKDIRINELEVDLVNSITSDNLAQLGMDGYESILDVTIEEGIIKNLPIGSSLYRVWKACVSIREQFFAKKVLSFLLEIKDIPTQKRAEFIQDLDNSEYGQRAGETILYLIERLDNLEKPKILGRLLKSKVNGDINTIQFLRLSAIVERAFMPDLKRLGVYGSKGFLDKRDVSVTGLVSLGLLSSVTTWTDDDQENKNLTPLGFELLEFGLKGV